MSFGKRALQGADALPRTASATPQPSTPKPKSLFHSQILQATVVLLICGGVAFYPYFKRKLFAPPNDPDGSEFVIPQWTAARRPLLDYRPPTAHELEASLTQQCMPDYPARQANEKLLNIHPLAVKVYLWTPDVEPPFVQIRLSQAAKYLECAMKAQPQRLCQPYFRKLLAEQLWSYGQVRAVAIRNKDVLATMPFPTSSNGAGAEMPQSSSFDSAMAEVFNDIHDAQVASTSPFDPRILDGVRDLSRKGYLKKSDFGNDAHYAPPEIADALVDAEVRSCP